MGRKWVSPQFQIVGIVNDTKYRSLRETPPPIFYTPDFGPSPQYSTFVLHVRTKTDLMPVIPAVRKMLASIDPRMPFYEVSTLEEDIDRSLWQDRMLVALGTTFGIFGASLAGIGLSGLLAYFVTARRREVGLRMALGAKPVHVSRLLGKQLLPAVATGLAGGTALVFVATVWIRPLLYEVKPSDPQVIALTTVLVFLVLLLAAAIPTGRALRIDPAKFLREE